MNLKLLTLILVLAVVWLAIADGQKQDGRKPLQRKPVGGNKKINKKQSAAKNKEPLQKSKRFVLTDIPELGKVKGKRTITVWTHKMLYQYYDIKYGETTSGKNRFKAPRPAQPWTGVRLAMTPRHACPSLNTVDFVEEAESDGIDIEDCLTLTISTKSHSTKAPVMVYIHGNYLYDGTPNEATPEYLLEKDVVLVSVRYRLGPFGFISTMTDHAPGNAGIKDVILALEWVQRHIDVFGGDPNRVTLFGQAGGAAIINVLTMSPIVPDGLFHRVIYQSGSALVPALTTDDPVSHAQEIAKKAGCKIGSSIGKLNKCLMKMNVTTLLDAFSDQAFNESEPTFSNFGGTQFVIGGPSEVLPDYPGKLIQDKKMRYYPTMGGVVKNPGTFVLKDMFEGNFNYSIPDDKYNGYDYIDYMIAHTNGDDPSGQWKKFSEKEFFSKQELKNGSFVKMMPGLIDMCSTIPFKNPVLLTLQANAEKLPEKTFLYTFNYEGEYHRYHQNIDDGADLPFDLGVSLADENLYLFRWPEYASFLNTRDTRVAKKMIDLWTSFAKDGVPTSSRIAEWPPMTDGSGPYLKIDRVSTVEQNFLDEYSAAVRDERKGFTLISETYFEGLAAEKEQEKQEAEQEAAQNQLDKEEDEDDADYDDDDPKKLRVYNNNFNGNARQELRNNLRANNRLNVVIARRVVPNEFY